MKKLLIYFMIIATCSSFNQIFAKNKMETTTLSIGKQNGNFLFNEDRTLSFKNGVIQGIVFNETVEQIYISKQFLNNQYCFIITDDDNQSKCYLINCYNQTGKFIKMDGPPMILSSFSPDTSMVLLGSYYEADMELYSVELSTFRLQKFKIPVEVKETDDGFPLEEISYNLDELKWIGNRTIELKANVNCSPYNDYNCDALKRKIILRSYIIEYDLLNNVTKSLIKI